MFDFFVKKGASLELAELMLELMSTVSEISHLVKTGSTGKAGTHNVFGDAQVVLDVEAEKMLEDYLDHCPFVATYGSEELEELRVTKHVEGKYSVFFDPIDGSSLVDVNFSVGTILGIYEGANVLGRTAREQVAAMVAVYGPRTTLLVTLGQGVHEFTWDGNVWHLTAEKMTLHGDAKYFAPGNLKAAKDREDYAKLVDFYIQNQYTLRYSGGMVPDVNHILKKGAGVFMYPGMPSHPTGKLRLLYECGPMAFLMEQAGGAASNGEKPILDLVIESLTQTSPIFIGQKEEVERCEKWLS
jgi:fructose-1,6-bisphosphatase I